jgi:hypothetical protein
MASVVEEIEVSYEGSPVALTRHVGHTDIVAGQHLPHIDDSQLQKQMSAACGVGNNRHTILTITAGMSAPAAGPTGQVQVLISSGDTPAGGYDAVIADPDRLVAKRCGLRDGGHVVVRPDGYIGAVVVLGDQAGVADYFAQIAR